MNRIVRYGLVLTLITASMAVMAKLPPWDYRIKLVKDTGGLAIVVRTFNGPAVTVGLENKSAKTVRCTAGFASYPHPPTADETRSATIASGKKATLAYPARNFGSEFSTAFVNVKCH